jgi:hypothetical protein
LEGETDEGVTLGAQECGDGGGVDSSGHGDGNGLFAALRLSGHGVLNFLLLLFSHFWRFGEARERV